jgi:type 1 fimbria pilin
VNYPKNQIRKLRQWEGIMKKFIVFLVTISLLFLVSGCANPQKEINITGNVKTVGSNISVNGTSTLEVGSEIKIELIKINSETVVEENTVKVDENGNYGLNFSREDREEDQKLAVSFYPNEQPEDIKEVYGTYGENISDSSDGLFTFNKDGEEHTGVRMFDLIYKVGNGAAGQRTFLLNHFDNPNDIEKGEN